jgi:hypothetical protein
VAHQHKYLLSMLIPVGFLMASGIANPHLFSVAVFRDTLPALQESPIPLYRRGNLVMYYTSQDLLHPEAFGKPGDLYEAVVFDIWPDNEGDSMPIQSLTWIRQIVRALSLQDAAGNSLPSVLATDADKNLVRDFESTFSRSLRLERGAIATFPLPRQSTYRGMSGMQALVAMAVKDPGEGRLLPKLKGSPQRLGEALDLAFRVASDLELTGVAVPFLPVSDSLGEKLSQSDSWRRILQEVDTRAAGTRLKVVLGGYGLLPENRRMTDTAFRQEWREWRGKLTSHQSTPVHEPLRLSALVALAAIAGAALRRKHFSLRRIVAITAVSVSTAAALIAMSNGVRPFWPIELLARVALLIEMILGLVAGLFIDVIVTFDTKQVLSQGD